MAEGVAPNGIHTPPALKANGLSMTEYASNPSPSSDLSKPKASTQVPEAFLLPNGYPDVTVL